MSEKPVWNIEQSRALYNIAHWSGGYFDIGPEGDMLALPKGKDGPSINLRRLVDELGQSGLSLPVLVRFSNILDQRVDTMRQAFAQAMQKEDYHATYTAVYPIKVNQQRRVVQEILRHGGANVGLEAGSKPELLAVLALSPHQGTIVCNGYKDREYIRLALIGQQFGLRPYIVIENLSELKVIIEEAARMQVVPNLGVRVRLASVGGGRWQNTGGEKAKFGLSGAQILEVVKGLSQANMLSSLRLMHFHMGSQIGNIRDVHSALREAGRYFAELCALGAPVEYIDVGGGLGVDYAGTHSRNECSINYSVQEYANNVVHTFWEICAEAGLQHPNIITESGRAMTAHHAVLITNVTDIEEAPGTLEPEPAQEGEHMIIHDLWYGLDNLNPHSAVEAYHDATYWLSEANALFTHGVLDLPQKVRAEQLYFVTCRRVRGLLQASSRSHREILDELYEKLADKYFCNFSLFQSLPDAWAIDQVFPIVPLQRLNERPDHRAILQDLTCDSDGRVERYVDAEGVETSLLIHEVKPEETYLLGFFLVGAYQEILGDLHNLFGDTHAINVELSEDGYKLSDPEFGDTVEDMLRYVHFEVDSLRNNYRQRLRASSLAPSMQQTYLAELQAGLSGYTYLEL